MEKYTKEQFWKLYEKLPQDLKDAVFSSETAENIYSICEKNKVESVPKISRLVNHVLLGILLLNEFQKILEKEIGLEKEKAEKISREINRFIFFPVKSSLEMLYKTEIVSSPEPAPFPKTSPEIPLETPTPLEAPSEKETEETDIYRESIE